MTEIAPLVALAAKGATFTLYLLVALSTFQLAIVIERAVVLYRTRGSRARLERLLTDGLAAGDLERLATALEAERASVARVLAAGVRAGRDGAAAAEHAIAGRQAELRLWLERRLAYLGTIGNNAPFLGLFGTVLGILHAFADLSGGAAGASRAVMAGISEALVATAVGLLVALPAVAAFNAFGRVVRGRMTDVESLRAVLLAHLSRPQREPARYSRAA